MRQTIIKVNELAPKIADICHIVFHTSTTERNEDREKLNNQITEE